MKKNNRKNILLLSFVAILFVVVTAMLLCFSGIRMNDNEKEGFKIFYSPDNHYRLVVTSKKRLLPVFSTPGQGSDGPGVVVLKDNATGEKLYEADLPIMNMLSESDIYWSEDEVNIKLIATWKLPIKTKNSSAE